MLSATNDRVIEVRLSGSSAVAVSIVVITCSSGAYPLHVNPVFTQAKSPQGAFFSFIHGLGTLREVGSKGDGTFEIDMLDLVLFCLGIHVDEDPDAAYQTPRYPDFSEVQ
jgi:hypothetical protein